jgi:hypothetical protein
MKTLALLMLVPLVGCLDFSVLEGRNGDLSAEPDASVGDLGDLGAPDLAGGPIDLSSDDAPPPPITFVAGRAMAVSDTVTAVAIQAPTGLVTDDVVLVELWWDDPTKTLNAPASLTELATYLQPGNVTTKWYWRKAVGDESTVAPYTFSWSGGTVDTGVIAVAYRGAITATMTPSDMAATPPYTIPPVTTTAPNQMLVPMIAFFQNATALISWTPPADLTLAKSGGGAVVFHRFVAAPQQVTFGMPMPDNTVNPIFVETVILSSQ